MNKQHCFDECTFVIFGATGDLTKRKLIPAIYKLIQDNKICKFALIGVSFDKTTKAEILKQAKKFISKPQQEIIKIISSSFFYYQMDFYDTASYQTLRKNLDTIEKKKSLYGNRLFYFATMPEHFIGITKNLVAHNIVKEHKETTHAHPWSRIVYEKPFGSDLKSSRTINRYLAKVFAESQIYRIDHYLGKELVGNIAITRFTNQVLEPIWNNKYIESVHINVCEKIGIQGRGKFYDATGAIKDMVQSHLLQLLALIAMEAPKKLTARYIRDAKAAVLKKVIIEKIIRGQYEGYRQEPGVHPQSTTETYAAIKLAIHHKRWRGVPFYLRTGKNLEKKDSHIEIRFKKVECLLDYCPLNPNSLIIRIEPNEGLYLNLNTKQPGNYQATPITMTFAHDITFGPNTPEAYEVLLSEVMKGDQSSFVRSDEVDYSWKIIEQIDKVAPSEIIPYEVGCTCRFLKEKLY